MPLVAADVTDHNAHGWYNYFGDHPLGESRWELHLEGQYRRHNVITQWQQLLLRPGINYKLNDRVTLTAGYCFVETHPYGDYPTGKTNFPEHRLWEQVAIKAKTGKVAWLTRLRFENRWLGGAAWRYENRFRGMERATIPLTAKTYFTAYDELWFFVPPYKAEQAFDQNRAYGALGFKLSPHWRFETGYMNQALLQRNGRVLESNHTLMLSVVTDAPFGGGH